MAKPPFYITTSIVYANAKPHIGYALELLIADAIARYKRLRGFDVYFLTGTDEHGIKIFDVAKTAGVDPQTFVDQVSQEVKNLSKNLDISYTDFIRTTDQSRHWPTAQKVWEQLKSNGDIELGHYSGYYSVNDEAYITKSEAESPEYANKQVVQIEEDNYMFKLGKYQSALLKKLEEPNFIYPAHRAKEMFNFAQNGLSDISFSRPKEKLSWGIPVPDDPNHVMYVWCDALTNYISAIGYLDNPEQFKRFWPADIHVIGKDILRFHSLFWPAMLTGIGEAMPKHILVHGHILSDGQKMSKSIGNVVDPIELINKWGTDALRYYLLREIPTLDDGDYSEARFIESYNSGLANDLGNLLSRTLTMAHKSVGGITPSPARLDDRINIGNIHELIDIKMTDFGIDHSLDAIWGAVSSLNQFVDTTKPWQLAKESDPSLAGVLYNLLESLRHLSIALYPFLPTTSDRIRKQLGLVPIDPNNFDFAVETQWGGLVEGHQLGESEILFPKDL